MVTQNKCVTDLKHSSCRHTGKVVSSGRTQALPQGPRPPGVGFPGVGWPRGDTIDEKAFRTLVRTSWHFFALVFAHNRTNVHAIAAVATCGGELVEQSPFLVARPCDLGEQPCLSSYCNCIFIPARSSATALSRVNIVVSSIRNAATARHHDE